MSTKKTFTILAVALTLGLAGQPAAASSLDVFTGDADPEPTTSSGSSETGRAVGKVVGAIFAAALVGAVDGATSRHRYRSSYRTKYRYDRNGQLGRISNRHYSSRIRYGRDGRIREIRTHWR